MKCPRCQHENRPQARFCEECGRPFKGATPTSRSHPNLKTEADLRQALTEALEQQTATSEILRVISSSPTDLQPVMDVVAESAARFCGATDATIWRLEGESLRFVAVHGTQPTTTPIGGTIAVTPRSVTGRVVLDRQTMHVEDIQASDTEFPETQERVRLVHVPTRTLLATPLLREDVPIGVIVLRRREVQLFTAKQIELLKTFADQAVIAIENVRLFTELKARNRDLTATSEILQVISRSPTDAQPVFETIIRSAVGLCEAASGNVYRFDGRLIHHVAQHGMTPEQLEASRRDFPRPPSRGSATGRAILTRTVVHIDIAKDPEYELGGVVQAGFRTLLVVPMLRDDEPIGTIVISRAEDRPFSDQQIALLQTFADQAVIAIENVRLFTELEEKNRALTEAHAQVTESLEQQTATGEILRVISSSPTDAQPVFEAIVQSAVRLCEAVNGGVFRLDGNLIHAAALHGMNPHHLDSIRRVWPRPADRGTTAGRAILTRAVVHVDIAEDPEYEQSVLVQAGFRIALSVPMLRDGNPIGAITLTREEGRPFSPKQIALLETFANQAVIAIENVRLFQELEARNRDLTEALEQQTATAEILRVISGSPTDVQPVFDGIARSAVGLCEAIEGYVYRFDGSLIHLVAYHGSTSPRTEAAQRAFPRPPGRGTATGRAILTRAVIHIDATKDPEYEESGLVRAGFRTVLSVPMLRDGEPIGAISVSREESRPFSDAQIVLLKTFADQAVIAIENVRLFNETKEALEQQTATAEILRVISSSPTDLQPVFDVMAQSAVRLCDGLYAVMYRFDGELIHFAAQHNLTPEGLEAVRRTFPVRPTRALGSGRAILRRAVVHIPDVEVDPEYAHQALRRAVGFRSGLWVPMMREGAPIGVIAVVRAEPGPFSDNQIELLKTFADQAVIAVENVRLFQELRARTADLTRSVEQLTALGEVSRAVSSTLDLDTVLDTIVTRAKQLAGTDGCTIYEYDEASEAFRLRASRFAHPHEAAVLDPIARATPIPKGQGLSGRAALLREPVHIPDIAVEGAYQSPVRAPLLQAGYRALLGVPLLREEQVVGVLAVIRKTPGDFGPEVVRVLMTFATQSALAIQNARLFREIEEKSRQLEAASRHKSEFLANMSHELRTPLNAILGFNEMILGQIYGEVPTDLREPLTDIQHSGKHLLRLINHVLDLSKIEAGRMELALTDYAVQDIVERVRASLQSLAAEKGLAFVATVSADIPLAYGDGGRITQCLMNLAGNALKFTHRGRVELGVELQGDVLVYRVTDTGIGIAPDKIEGVFTEFRQGDATITSEFGGTGLGLSITRKFVEMHGGRIWVESEVGSGSTFFFAIPVRLTGGTPV